MADTNYWGSSWSSLWGTSWTRLEGFIITEPVYGPPFVTGYAPISPTLSFSSKISPTLSFYAGIEEDA